MKFFISYSFAKVNVVDVLTVKYTAAELLMTFPASERPFAPLGILEQVDGCPLHVYPLSI